VAVDGDLAQLVVGRGAGAISAAEGPATACGGRVAAAMTRQAGGALTAVLGVADHSGWAVCVTVAARGGIPVVVDRRRVELVEPGVPSQPYHHQAVGMPLPAAEALVARVRESVLRTTAARLSEIRDELEPRCRIAAMTLRVPPLSYVPVTVAEAHASRPVMVRADSMMYHDAIRRAAERLGLVVSLHRRGEEAVCAADRLGVRLEDLEAFLLGAGERFGPPWRREHRLAAAAAMTALADRVRLSLPA
jgi:hypothetical protein